MKASTQASARQTAAEQPASILQANRVTLVSLGFIVLMGAFIRYQYVAHSAFPINDGGLFYTMTRDLIANGWRIPAATSYNHLAIPFGYPPLGFYLTGFLATLFHLDLLQLFRFLPLVFAILSIPAFFLLAREILHSDAQALYAGFAFAMLPPAFEWLIMGGGITRAPGFCFALLTLYQALVLMRTGRWVHLLLAVVFGALTALSHLEMLWVLAISGVYFGLIRVRKARGLLQGVLFALGVAILTAPYWLTVIHLNGLTAFLTAFKGNDINPLYSLLNLLASNLTVEPFLTLFGVLALVGAFSCVVRKDWQVTGWLLALLFLNPRSINRSCALPIALLAGIAFHNVILPGFSGVARRSGQTGGDRSFIDDVQNGANRIGLTLIMVWGFASGIFAYYLNQAPMRSLSSPQRAAMVWVKDHTPAQSRFFVVPSSTNWYTDLVAEWFPALTERASLVTVQGHEWISYRDFDQIQIATGQIVKCAQATLPCIERLGVLSGGFDYVFVPLQGGEAEMTRYDQSVAASIAGDPRFTTVYQNSEVAVYQRVKSQ